MGSKEMDGIICEKKLRGVPPNLTLKKKTKILQTPTITQHHLLAENEVAHQTSTLTVDDK